MLPAKPLIQRFLEKVELIPFHTCWEWMGYRAKNGFGQLNRGRRGEGLDYAHRISYEIHLGPIPKGENVIQSCQNRGCVNPMHLYTAKSRVEHTKTDLKERLMSRVLVNEETGCWEYTHGKDQNGYGKLGYGPREMGTRRAHIISWEVHNGEIPQGLFVLHHCDNPPCINPEHLFLGTQGDNIQDAIDKGRMWYQK